MTKSKNDLVLLTRDHGLATKEAKAELIERPIFGVVIRKNLMRKIVPNCGSGGGAIDILGFESRDTLGFQNLC